MCAAQGLVATVIVLAVDIAVVVVVVVVRCRCCRCTGCGCVLVVVAVSVVAADVVAAAVAASQPAAVSAAAGVVAVVLFRVLWCLFLWCESSMYGPCYVHVERVSVWVANTLRIYRDIPTLFGFFIRGFLWDIPILILAYVLFGGPIYVQALRVDSESRNLRV